MLDAIRSRIAGALEIMARRVTGDPRNPAETRIVQPYRTMAAVRITPDTAVTISAVWACLRYLSQTVAVLPWHVMRDGKNGSEVAKAHPVDWLLWKRASDEWSSFQFRETLMHWALRHGNGYAEIEPDQAGRPFALWPIHPDRVSVCRAIEPGVDAHGDSIPQGALFYDVDQGGSGLPKMALSAKRVFHIRGFGEGPVGVNVISYAAESLGWAKAVQLFGAAFFGNGANVATAVINKKVLSPEGLKYQQKQFEKKFTGVKNAFRPIFLDGDSDIKQLGLDAEKSQLTEVNLALVAEVCRWFGVPPHKVMDLSRATFSNIEHQAIEVVVDSVSPWVKRFEDEADCKLFGQQNRQSFYTKMNMRALLRGDNASRVAYYQGMTSIGAYSPNRVLELEDENTLGPEGDVHVMQSQWTTLDRIEAGDNLKKDTAAPPDTTPSPQREDDDVAAITALQFMAEREGAHVG